MLEALFGAGVLVYASTLSLFVLWLAFVRSGRPEPAARPSPLRRRPTKLVERSHEIEEPLVRPELVW